MLLRRSKQVDTQTGSSIWRVEQIIQQRAGRPMKIHAWNGTHGECERFMAQQRARVGISFAMMPPR